MYIHGYGLTSLDHGASHRKGKSAKQRVSTGSKATESYISSDGKMVDRKPEEDTVTSPNLSSLSNIATKSNNSNLSSIGCSSKPEDASIPNVRML